MHFAEESLHKYRQSAKATCRTFESESSSATERRWLLFQIWGVVTKVPKRRVETLKVRVAAQQLKSVWRCHLAFENSSANSG